MLVMQRYIPVFFNMFILLISLIFLILAYTSLSPDSAMAPKLISSFVIIVTIFTTFNDIKKIKNESPSNSVEETEGEQGSFVQKPMWFILSLTVIYYIMIITLGFYVSTIMFLFFVPYFYKFKRWKIIILTCVTLILVYWIGFSILMKVRFPTGILL